MLKRFKKFKTKTSEKLESKSNLLIQWIGSVQSLVIHTILFTSAFALHFLGVDISEILSVTTLIVSFEAIYLSIFIQMSVNRQTKKIDLVAEDMGEIQENVEDIQENVEDIQEDIEDIQKDVEEFNEDDDEEDEDFVLIKETMDKLMAEILEMKNKKIKR